MEGSRWASTTDSGSTAERAPSDQPNKLFGSTCEHGQTCTDVTSDLETVGDYGDSGVKEMLLCLDGNQSSLPDTLLARIASDILRRFGGSALVKTL